jgi:hypothetical protein
LGLKQAEGARGAAVLTFDSFVDRLAFRSRLVGLPPFRSMRAHSVAARTRAFSSSRPRGAHAIGAVADQIRRDGVAPLDLAAFDTLLPGQTTESLKGLVEAIGGGWRWGADDSILEADAVFRLRPEIYLAGMEAALLDLAETYIGQSCYYLACTLKCERPDARVFGTRHWHLDVEDERMLRVLVYLNDVDADGGPFEYLAPQATERFCTEAGYSRGYANEAFVRTSLSEADRKRSLGRAGSAVIFDGTRVLHRASLPTGRARYSLTFTYTSRRPKRIYRASRLGQDTKRAVDAIVGARERAAIPAARLF